MKKKSYKEHKQYCREMKITSRQEWRVASSKDDFPKSLYKNVEKSFSDKGEWISSEDFYFREIIAKDLTENDFLLLDIKIKQLFLAEKQYSKLRLKESDELIYAYLMLNNFTFIRKDRFSAINNKLIELFSDNNYKSCPSFISSQSRPISTNYYEEILSYDNDLLNAEREFLFYSILYLNFKYDVCKKILRYAYTDYFEDINFYLSSNNSEINIEDIQKTMDYFLSKDLNSNLKKRIPLNRYMYSRYVDQNACDRYRKNPDPKKIITKNPFKIFFNNIEKDKNRINDKDFDKIIEETSFNIGQKIYEKYILSADRLKIEIDNIDEEDDLKRGLLLKYTGYLINFIGSELSDRLGKFLNISLRDFDQKSQTLLMHIEAFLKKQIGYAENSNIVDDMTGRRDPEADIIFNNSETVTERNCFRAVNHFKRHKLDTLLTNDLFYNYFVIPAKKYFYDNIPPFLISKLKSVKNSRENDIGLIVWAAKGGIYEAINWDSQKHYDEHRNKIEYYGDIGLDENNNLLSEFDQEFTDDFLKNFGNIKKYINGYENLESIESINAEEIFQIDKSLLNNYNNHSRNLIKSFKIYDQSMSPTFNEGDTVIINPQSKNKDKISLMELVSGRHYLIKKDSNYFARKIIIHEALKKDYILLKSTNADWPDTEVKFDEIEVIGQIIQLIKTVDT